MSTKVANPKVPAAVFGLAGRYASALYMAAVKANVLDVVEKDFGALSKAMKDEPQFARFVNDPTIKRTVKAVEMAKATASADETTKKMIGEPRASSPSDPPASRRCGAALVAGEGANEWVAAQPSCAKTAA
jgi:hypothetical protein